MTESLSSAFIVFELQTVSSCQITTVCPAGHNFNRIFVLDDLLSASIGLWIQPLGLWNRLCCRGAAGLTADLTSYFNLQYMFQDISVEVQIVIASLIEDHLQRRYYLVPWAANVKVPEGIPPSTACNVSFLWHLESQQENTVRHCDTSTL
jgi:hypothetical protein